MTLRGRHYRDNDTIDINDVGVEDTALICWSSLRHCCRSLRIGEWYYPNGTAVPTSGEGRDFYRNRGYYGEVRLNRRHNVVYPTGIYHCEIPDARSTTRVIHVGLISGGHYGKFCNIIAYMWNKLIAVV